LPPNDRPGTGRFTLPVARITALPAVKIRSPTRTSPSAVRAPSPLMSSMSFFLNNPATPPVSVLMTFLRRSPIAPKSTSGSVPFNTIPNSPASRTSVRMSALRNTALAGMHA
jgi:hypothetical protein